MDNKKYLDELIKVENEYLGESFSSCVPTYSQIEICHHEVIKRQVLTFLEKMGLKENFKSIYKDFNSNFLNRNRLDIPESNLYQCLEEFHQIYLRTEFDFSNGEVYRKNAKNTSKRKGAYYTPQETVQEIVKRTLEFSVISNETKILDFACGTGRFYFEIVDYLFSKHNIDPRLSAEKIVHGYDNDPVSILILKLGVIEKYNVTDETFLKNIICKDLILEEKDLFSGQSECFDHIVSNPPFLNLKYNKSDNPNDEFKLFVEDYVNRIRNSNNYKFSLNGMLNLYRLSLEKMFGLLDEGGTIGLIIPSTFLGDKMSEPLRKFFLRNGEFQWIKFNKENKKLFKDVSQSTVQILYCKGKTSNYIYYDKNEDNKIPKNTIINNFPDNYEIPILNKLEVRILEKLSKFRKLKEFEFIRNRRGELDLSLHKRFIQDIEGLKMVRGKTIFDDDFYEFVDSSFLEVKTKEYVTKDFSNDRIVCPQISNIDSKSRIRFNRIKPNIIVSNSCNYISLTDYKDSLDKLKSILNSTILNWFFKLTSSNNHINNYELDNLPLIEFWKYSENLTDRKICELFGLSKEETEYILNEKEVI